MKEKNINIICVIIVACAIVLLLLDGFNVFSKIGVDLNIGAWNIFVAIALFLVTYFTIDGKNIRRKHNQEEVARTLIQKTYDSVSEYLKIYDMEKFYYIVSKKMSGDDLLPDNKIYNNLKSAPFIFEERIFEYAKEGIISATNMDYYIDVKQKYEKYLSLVIVLGDEQNAIQITKKEAWAALDKAQKELSMKSSFNSKE